MKLNQELIKRLATGEIAYKPSSFNDQHFHTITDACGFKREKYLSKTLTPIYAFNQSKNSKLWFYYTDREKKLHPNLPIFTTEQFFEAETDHVPDVRKTMDAETRELAKSVFLKLTTKKGILSKEGQMKIIQECKQFIKLLNEHE